MGSTGNANTANPQNAQPQPQSQSLADDADKATITQYYKDNYGIRVGGSYFRDGNDPRILVETAKVLDTFTQELGADVMAEMGINLASHALGPRAMGKTDIKSKQITVNSRLFKSLSALDANMQRQANSHFHPANSLGADVITHEVGHNLEFLINKRMNPNNTMRQWVADSNQTYAKAIVQQAYAELKQEQPHLYATEKQARAAISGYADSKWHGTVAYTECMAEAVADYGRNGNNANPLSRKIWAGIKAMLQ